MEIIWHGLSFFEIRDKREEEKVTMGLNPFSESTGFKLPKIKVDILILSTPPSNSQNRRIIENAFLNSKGALKTGFTKPFLIDGPGEYEVKGFRIKGLTALHVSSGDRKESQNIIFKIEFKGINICYLGNFNENQISSHILESILGIDILFVPIGGYLTISGREAAKIVTQVEPKIVIPMNYLPSGFKSSPETKNLKINLETEKIFLKALGVKGKERTKKLRIKASDLQVDGTEVILLKMI